ncbi:hypothetical protein U1Q18_015696 [Sarracenia purpurea var. burkii]
MVTIHVKGMQSKIPFRKQNQKYSIHKLRIGNFKMHSQNKVLQRIEAGLTERSHFLNDFIVDFQQKIQTETSILRRTLFCDKAFSDCQFKVVSAELMDSVVLVSMSDR